LVLYAHALALAGVGADFLSLGHITVARTYITSIEHQIAGMILIITGLQHSE
jgi:putative Mn2+ efflux pump MntP